MHPVLSWESRGQDRCTSHDLLVTWGSAYKGWQIRDKGKAVSSGKWTLLSRGHKNIPCIVIYVVNLLFQTMLSLINSHSFFFPSSLPSLRFTIVNCCCWNTLRSRRGAWTQSVHLDGFWSSTVTAPSPPTGSMLLHIVLHGQRLLWGFLFSFCFVFLESILKNFWMYSLLNTLA